MYETKKHMHTRKQREKVEEKNLGKKK